MATNIIVAKFCADQTRAWTDELWQYDYGQILKFDGLELPDAYEVHFSNQPLTGETITQIGTADGVTIPDQFLQSGEVVYAWVYLHAGEDDGETEYMVTIPVSKRPEPSDEQPTPVEQSAIDQAIAALNIAVEKADEAITHYPKIQSGTWWVWDVTAEEYVDTEVEAQGETGPQGPQGPQGEYAEVDSALSDTSTNPVQNKVINGALSDLTDDLNHKVSDVKINGTSIVDANNEADIPVASSSDLGAVQISGYGLANNYGNVPGLIGINKASSANTKAGTHNYNPIVPSNQHESVFYGLAKAASDTTQSASSNPVGTYTETAKQKINAMLEPQFRLIKTINITGATEYFHILADDNNNPFSLTELVLYFDGILGSSNGNVGIAVNNGTTASTNAFLAVNGLLNSSTVQYRAAHLRVVGGRFFGEAISQAVAQNYQPATMATSLNATGIIPCSNIEEIYIKSFNSFNFTSGTITIYGR